MALAAARDARLAYVLLFLAGIAMIANGAVSNTMLQHSVPDALRGRLMAAYSFVVVGLAQTVGSFLAGIVAKALGEYRIYRTVNAPLSARIATASCTSSVRLKYAR